MSTSLTPTSSPDDTCLTCKSFEGKDFWKELEQILNSRFSLLEQKLIDLQLDMQTGIFNQKNIYGIVKEIKDIVSAEEILITSIADVATTVKENNVVT